ncbi:MAG: TIM barrel protein [Gemmataceae bacterium]
MPPHRTSAWRSSRSRACSSTRWTSSPTCHARVNHPAFGLTVDVGHLVCNGELPVSEHLVRWKDWLWNVHIEDMRRGVHDHLMFGEGEVDFADVFAGLRAANYQGMVSVELSRHSHDAVNVARKSFEFLRRFV